MRLYKEFLESAIKNDPSFKNKLEVFLYPGFWALVYYKISRFFYLKNCYFISRLFMEMGKFFINIEIHPGAVIG